LTARLRRVVEAEDGRVADALIQVAAQQALRGDHRFWTSIIDRLDGKVPERIAGHDGGPLIRDVGNVALARVTGKVLADADDN